MINHLMALRMRAELACFLFLFVQSPIWAQTEPVPTRPPGSLPDKLAARQQELMSALVVVEGERANGSGFLIKMDGKTFLVTNAHVLEDAGKVSFKTMQNVRIEPGPFEIAAVDLVRAVVSDALPALELHEAISTSITLGQELVVLGNAEGTGTVRVMDGHVLGIGPEQVETDAPFVAGNSGSPIIHINTGKVVGVATYLTVPVGLGGVVDVTRMNQVRRFGYRLDTIKEWTITTEGRLVKEWLKINETKELTELLLGWAREDLEDMQRTYALMTVFWENMPDKEHIKALRRAVAEFQTRINRSNLTPLIRKRELASFFRHLAALCMNDIRGIRKEHFSGQNKHHYEAILKAREGLTKYFTRAAASIESDAGKVVSIQPYQGPGLESINGGRGAPSPSPTPSATGGLLARLKNSVWRWCDRDETLTFFDGTATGSWFGINDPVTVSGPLEIKWGGHTLTFNAALTEFTGHWTSPEDKRWGKRIR